ncbi:MAG: DUF3750 domain-containing protein [Ahrensia sp.]|nr:DUF3750 domain-containing protein [Ahrensia sp.]
MSRLISYPILFLLLVFIVPSLVHLGVWAMKDRPSRWNHADWSSAGILAKKPDVDEAAVYVMSARTGGLKGAFASHSWLVIKTPGVARYDRYEVVGWGTPVRKNAYDADARWYSNNPRIEQQITGDAARRLIPQIEQAVASYRWRNPGDYTIWPGPNSNTFVASVIRAVPDFRAETPSTAVGRDYPADGRWIGRTGDGSWFASLGGYAGVVLGADHGLELNFLGLVAGFNPKRLEIKVPSFGSFRLT